MSENGGQEPRAQPVETSDLGLGRTYEEQRRLLSGYFQNQDVNVSAPPGSLSVPRMSGKNANSTFFPDLPRQRQHLPATGSRDAWTQVLMDLNATATAKGLERVIESGDTLFDNGTEHVLVPVEVASSLLTFVKVLRDHGSPTGRDPLSLNELTETLLLVNARMRRNSAVTNPEVQPLMDAAPGDMPRRVAEGILTALYVLEMVS